MGRRRKNQEPPMTFFSFQDIVACTTGIMVLITLLLAMELVECAEGKGPEPSPPNVARLKATVIDLQRQRDELAKLVRKNGFILRDLTGGVVITDEQLKALADKVIALGAQVTEVSERIAKKKKDYDDKRKRIDEAKYETRVAQVPLPPRSASGKTANYVECDAARIRVGQIGSDGAVPEMASFAGDGCLASFVRWARERADAKDKEYYVVLVRPQGVEHFGPIKATLQDLKFELGWGVWPPEKKLFDKP